MTDGPVEDCADGFGCLAERNASQDEERQNLSVHHCSIFATNCSPPLRSLVFLHFFIGH